MLKLEILLTCSKPENIRKDFKQDFGEEENLLTDTQKLEGSLGKIVNMIMSYDMGWLNRGNGRSYNSLNGYGTVIGFLSGKRLDNATRNRKCAVLNKNGVQKKHDCRKNFDKSAKAMEADVDVQLICHSEILKDAGCRVKVLVGDEDQCAIRYFRNEIRCLGIKEEIYQLADRNHVKKNFRKSYIN